MRKLGKVKKIYLHHSASPRPTTTLVDIRRWHLEEGYSDVGYHYFIDGQGRLHVGRPAHLEGAHTLGFNRNSLGICVAGNFQTEPPTPAQIETLAQLLAVLCRRHGLTENDILGHLDVLATSCPGRHLYAYLPYLRRKVRGYLKGA